MRNLFLILLATVTILGCKKESEPNYFTVSDQQITGFWYIRSLTIFTSDTATNLTTASYEDYPSERNGIHFMPDSAGHQFAEFGALSKYIPGFGRWYYDNVSQLMLLECTTCDSVQDNVWELSYFSRNSDYGSMTLQRTLPEVNGKIVTLRVIYYL